MRDSLTQTERIERQLTFVAAKVADATELSVRIKDLVKKSEILLVEAQQRKSFEAFAFACANKTFRRCKRSIKNGLPQLPFAPHTPSFWGRKSTGWL